MNKSNMDIETLKDSMKNPINEYYNQNARIEMTEETRKVIEIFLESSIEYIINKKEEVNRRMEGRYEYIQDDEENGNEYFCYKVDLMDEYCILLDTESIETHFYNITTADIEILRDIINHVVFHIVFYEDEECGSLLELLISFIFRHIICSFDEMYFIASIHNNPELVYTKEYLK